MPRGLGAEGVDPHRGGSPPGHLPKVSDSYEAEKLHISRRIERNTANAAEHVAVAKLVMDVVSDCLSVINGGRKLPLIADDPMAHHAGIWQEFCAASPGLRVTWHKVKFHRDLEAAEKAGRRCRALGGQ